MSATDDPSQGFGDAGDDPSGAGAEARSAAGMPPDGALFAGCVLCLVIATPTRKADASAAPASRIGAAVRRRSCWEVCAIRKRHGTED